MGEIVAVNPPKVNATLIIGEKITVLKTVNSPAFPPKADIVFLADTTGSMAPALNNVKENAKEILKTVLDSQPTAQFAVSDYKDKEHSRESDLYDFHLEQDLTTDADAVAAAINKWTASGGGDTPENQLYALYQLATGAVSWRTNSTPIIVWFGDAPGHNDDPSLDNVIDALQKAGIKVIAVSVTTGAGGLGPQADAITNATSGIHLIDVAPSTVADVILNGLQNLPVTVNPVAVDSNPLVITFDPITATVTSGKQVQFTETIAMPVESSLTGTVEVSCFVEFRDQFTGELVAESAVQNISVKIVPAMKELVLKGTDVWLDTGLDITSGDQIIITATGKWRNDGQMSTYWVDANGFDTYKNPEAILPDSNFASLIGRIGNSGTPFFVGSNFGPSSLGAGRLFLQMNDIPGLSSDNEGELKVTIEIK